MNPLQVLQAELREVQSKKRTALNTIDMCDKKSELLEEAIEQLKQLPRYWEIETEDERNERLSSQEGPS